MFCVPVISGGYAQFLPALREKEPCLYRVRPQAALQAREETFFGRFFLLLNDLFFGLLVHRHDNDRFFSRFRRHAVVVLLIVAALVTPTGDPFTLLVVFIPLYGLWEFSAALVPPSHTQLPVENEKQ